MRLICPNCDAQYEVPDEVMPAEGRDVQCSSCGQTWFQDHPDTIAEAEEQAANAPAEDEEIVSVPMPEPAAAPKVPEFPKDPDAPAFEPETPAPARRTVNPDVASVLREEAEFETRARKSDNPGGLESQPDLGLTDTDGADDASRRADETRDRMAKLRGEKTNSPEQMHQYREEVAVAAAGSRRDLLPDIEEINSTLRSNSDRAPGSDSGQTAQVEVREKRSSRRGFILTVALVAIVAVVYVNADIISEAVPQTAAALDVFVSMIDRWRGWLDGKVEGVLSWLDAVAVSSSQ